jgi:hypothetical protein
MTPTPTAHPGDPTYAIRVQGRLGPRWSAWFEGADVSSDDDGTTTIVGAVLDQAALHGLLQRVRDLGLPILSVQRVTGSGDDDGASAIPSSRSKAQDGPVAPTR